MSFSATPERPLSHSEAWPLEKRRDDLRAAVYLGIVTGNDRANINGQAWIDNFGAKIKLTTFDKWWAEELARFQHEQAEKLTRIPPNSCDGEGGK